LIVYDQPTVWNPKYGLSCHLISTFPGEEGRIELLNFIKQLNINSKHIQNLGQETEHFDIFGSKLDLLRKIIPLPITRKEFVKIIRNKRILLNEDKK
jgi:hypothetical protein